MYLSVHTYLYLTVPLCTVEGRGLQSSPYLMEVTVLESDQNQDGGALGPSPEIAEAR